MGRKDRSRTLILDAAEAAFAEIGFAQISMEGIARRAGLTRMTLYNLFASKERIAYAIAERSEAREAPAYLARIAKGEDAMAVLEDALVATARWSLAHPTLAAVVLSPSSDFRALAPPADRLSFHGLVVALLAEGQKQGTIRCDLAPDVMTLLVLGTYSQMLLYAIAGGDFEEAWIAAALRMAIEGLGAKPSVPKATLRKRKPRSPS